MSELKKHPFQDSWSGYVCEAMVLRGGYGDQCGLPASDPIHQATTEREQIIFAAREVARHEGMNHSEDHAESIAHYRVAEAFNYFADLLEEK